MADVDHECLLHRFRPALLYDSQEAYFADHPAQMVVNPGNTLRRKDGKVARTDDGTLTLATLAPTYADGRRRASTTCSRSRRLPQAVRRAARAPPRAEEPHRRARQARQRAAPVAAVLALVLLQRLPTRRRLRPARRRLGAAPAAPRRGRGPRHRAARLRGLRPARQGRAAAVGPRPQGPQQRRCGPGLRRARIPRLLLPRRRLSDRGLGRRLRRRPAVAALDAADHRRPPAGLGRLARPLGRHRRPAPRA